MKISILGTFDNGGGAARSAYRLHCGLLKLGVKSIFFTQNKRTEDSSVEWRSSSLHKLINLFRSRIDSLPLTFYRKRNRNSLFSVAFLFVSNWVKKNIFTADLLHLHWVQAGFISIESLRNVKAPVVWTMHDSWLFTGGCHLPEGCLKYLGKCGSCPQLQSSMNFDLSWMTLERKKYFWSNLNLTLVAPSNWLASCARQSSLFKNHRVEVIPNGIDTSIYKPLDKMNSREILGLDRFSKIILFGAVNATTDLNKGVQFIGPAIEELLKIKNMSSVKLVVFGASGPNDRTPFSFDSHYVGRFSDDITLALLYSAADVMLVPSMQENLPNTVMEAMSCGTPVVAFNVGGISDLIDHKVNGYLAKTFDVGDLTNGLLWTLEDCLRRDEMSLQCRKKIVDNFDLAIVANRYRDLYEELIKKSHLQH